MRRNSKPASFAHWTKVPTTEATSNSKALHSSVLHFDGSLRACRCGTSSRHGTVETAGAYAA